MGEERKMYKVLVGRPEGKRPLERPRRIRGDGIRICLGKIGWESVEWIQLAQDKGRWRAFVNMVMNQRDSGATELAANEVQKPIELICATVDWRSPPSDHHHHLMD
jgi:hypothetical protein